MSLEKAAERSRSQLPHPSLTPTLQLALLASSRAISLPNTLVASVPHQLLTFPSLREQLASEPGIDQVLRTHVGMSYPDEQDRAWSRPLLSSCSRKRGRGGCLGSSLPAPHHSQPAAGAQGYLAPSPDSQPRFIFPGGRVLVPES